MPPKNKPFSFSAAAASQPTRQRFSFSQAAGTPPKQEPQQLDSFFPTQKIIARASEDIRYAPEKKPSNDQVLASEVARGITISQGKPEQVNPLRKLVQAIPGSQSFEKNVFNPVADTFNSFFPSYQDYLRQEVDKNSQRSMEEIKKAANREVGKSMAVVTPGKTVEDTKIIGLDIPAVGRIKNVVESKFQGLLDEAKDTILRRFEEHVPPTNLEGGAKQAPIFGINSQEKAAFIESLRAKKGATVADVNKGLELLRVEGKKVEDIAGMVAPVINDVPKKGFSFADETSKLKAPVTEELPVKPFSFAEEATTAPINKRLAAYRAGNPSPIGGHIINPLAKKAESQLPTSPIESSIDDIIPTTKLEKRFVDNFPELGKADALDVIRTQTRGVISNEQSLAKAAELGYTEDRILHIPEGKALNAEEKLAVSGVVEHARLNLKSMEENLVKLEPQSVPANDLRSVIAQQRVKLYKLMAVENGVAAEAGRALQAHKATISAIDQNERWLSKKLNDPKVSQDVKDYIYRRIGEFNGTPNEINKLLRELHEASLMDKLVEFATAAKLWAPQTHLVNMISSTVRTLMQSPLHGISALIEGLRITVTGKQRERFFSDAVSEVQGQMAGWRHSGTEALKALLDENYAFESRKLQDFEPRGPAIKGRPGKNQLRDKIMDGFGKAVRLPFRALGVEDVLIRKPAEMGALYTATNRLARMSGLKPGTKAWTDFVSDAILNPSLDTMKQVENIADNNLFQESLHPSLRRISEIRDHVPVLKFIVPFFRTIVNLQKQAIEFSAFAPILPSVRKSLASNSGAQSDAIAKMVLGTAVTIPLIMHAQGGNITLAAPTNPAERDKFYADGKQPYAVKIGEKWYPYNRFSPYSDWFVMAGAIGEATDKNDHKTVDELMAHIFFTMTQNFFDKSFATGMHDFLDAMSDPERGDNWVQNFATGATIPNIIPLAARVIDPVVRQTSSLKEAYMSKVPYLSKTLPAKTDVFGKPISRPGSAVERAISPLIPTPVAVDTVRKELDSIGYEMGFPGKTAGGFKMDDETYRIFQAASGKIVYSALFQMVQNPGYQALSPQQKEKAINKIVTDVRDGVKQQVAKEQLIMQQIKSELKNRGYSSSQADEMAVKTYEIIKSKQQTAQ